MIPRKNLVEEAKEFFKNSEEYGSRLLYIKIPEKYTEHCYGVAVRSWNQFSEVFDNYGDAISELLDPAGVLDSHNMRKMFEESGYVSGLLHDIGDAYVPSPIQVVATHVGKLLLEMSEFPEDITRSVGSSWVAKEELEVAQVLIKNNSAPRELEKIKDWVMMLDPDDYVQNSVQQLVGTAVDIGDDFDSRIDSYIKRRRYWRHDTLVEALILGKERLRDVYELANKLVEGKLSPEQVRKIGVIPLY